MIKESWKKQGYIDEPIPENIDIKAEIKRMCKEKNAIILAHYYTDKPLQEIADFIGDSLALARKAAETDASIIVMCGVHFMGETNKILCPDKKVLIPDLNASCSLAESCPADKFREFVAAHPDHKVISYVNTTAATKTVTDIVVTSGNARQIVESFPKAQKLIFGPDRNLGEYINSITGRQMLLWDGACHVHERFSVEVVLALKEQYPDAKVLVHPECKGPVVKLADVVGSTAKLLDYAVSSDAKQFIVATESGILFEMQKQAPEKQFIPVPPASTDGESIESGTSGLETQVGVSYPCHCNECAYMKLNTMTKLYNTLRYEWPEVEVEPAVIEQARRPIDEMLRVSKLLNI